MLWALLFKGTLVLLLVGVLTWLSFEVLVRSDRRLTALVVSLILSYAAFELVGGLVLGARMAKKYTPDVDHRLVPNSAPDINGDGIRSRFEAEDFTAGTYNIIFLGDSFTYGLLLDDISLSFPAQVERMLAEAGTETPVRCVNFGWPSSSPLLSSRLLEDIGDRYKPDLVILNLDMTDFDDDPRYALSIGTSWYSPTELLIRETGLHWLAYELAESFRPLGRMLRPGGRRVPRKWHMVNQPLAASRRHLGTIEGNIERLARHSQKHLGATFVLIMLPRHFQYNALECPQNGEAFAYELLGPHVEEPFRWLEDLSRRVDFPCHSLLDDFKKSPVFPTCFEGDPHWNSNGHMVAAQGVVRVLEEEALVPMKTVSSEPTGR